jgi:hypothetical protein
LAIDSSVTDMLLYVQNVSENFFVCMCVCAKSKGELKCHIFCSIFCSIFNRHQNLIYCLLVFFKN